MTSSRMAWVCMIMDKKEMAKMAHTHEQKLEINMLYRFSQQRIGRFVRSGSFHHYPPFFRGSIWCHLRASTNTPAPNWFMLLLTVTFKSHHLNAIASIDLQLVPRFLLLFPFIFRSFTVSCLFNLCHQYRCVWVRARSRCACVCVVVHHICMLSSFN